jgi:acetolactate decarboxylase
MSKFYQISTLNTIMLGNYDGVITVGDLLKQGSMGIGTFEGLDGEMIVLDGKAYSGKATGCVEEYGPEKKVPFAVVSDFTQNAKLHYLENLSDLKQLKVELDKLVDKDFKNKNVFYLFKAEVELNSVKVRSYYKQKKPYKTLLEVSSSQMEYSYENCRGYLVGVWCQKYVDGLNMPGWHLHFLSQDKTKGGHLLEVSIKKAAITLEDKNDYEILLPSNEEFKSLNLIADLKEAVKKVEG